MNDVTATGAEKTPVECRSIGLDEIQVVVKGSLPRLSVIACKGSLALARLFSKILQRAQIGRSARLPNPGIPLKNSPKTAARPVTPTNQSCGDHPWSANPICPWSRRWTFLVASAAGRRACGPRRSRAADGRGEVRGGKALLRNADEGPDRLRRVVAHPISYFVFAPPVLVEPCAAGALPLWNR